VGILRAGRFPVTVLVLQPDRSLEKPSMLTLEERLVVVDLYEDVGSYRAVPS
jgi:hypothetical protein